MEGPEGDRGVAFLTLADLFRIAAARRMESEFDVTVSMLEARSCLCVSLKSQASLCYLIHLLSER